MRKLSEYFPDTTNSELGSQYEVIESSTNSKVSQKWILKCDLCSKTFIATPLDIFRGCKPCACGTRYYKTSDLKIEKLMETVAPKNISFDTSITIDSSHQRVDFTCNNCNHKWSAKWTHVVNRGSGCAKCNGNYKYSTTETIDFINNSTAYKFHSVDFDRRITNRDNVNVECLTCGCIWKKLVSDATKNRFGCPKCASHGYNPESPGSLYILSIRKEGELLGFKFGISNSPFVRVKELCSNNELEIKPIVIFDFEKGLDAYSLEQGIMKKFSRFISKNAMQDGYTETFAPSDLTSVVQLIYENIKIKESTTWT